MNKRVVIGTYGLEQEININPEKAEIIPINSLKQFVKAGWLNNLDAFVVNSKSVEKAIVYELDQVLEQFDLCVVVLGNDLELSARNYELAYENIDEKAMSNDILNFVVDKLWNYKNSKSFNDEDIVAAELNEANEAEIFKVLQSLINYIDHKDDYTKKHCERVARYTDMMVEASEFGIDKDLVLKAALVHDVGKIGVPPKILMKKDRLDDDEYSMMQQHTQIGDHLLSNRYFTKLKPIIRAHHERYDGRGYPDNLAGEEIPLEARVLAIADAFDAMTTQRGYNNPRDFEEAIAQLEKNSGRQFDPNIVAAFVESLRKDTYENDQEKAPQEVLEAGKAM